MSVTKCKRRQRSLLHHLFDFPLAICEFHSHRLLFGRKFTLTVLSFVAFHKTRLFLMYIVYRFFSEGCGKLCPRRTSRRRHRGLFCRKCLKTYLFNPLYIQYIAAARSDVISDTVIVLFTYVYLLTYYLLLLCISSETCDVNNVHKRTVLIAVS